MFVTGVTRCEAGTRLKPGVKQMIMKGNTIVSSGQHQHSGGTRRVGVVSLP